MSMKGEETRTNHVVDSWAENRIVNDVGDRRNDNKLRNSRDNFSQESNSIHSSKATGTSTPSSFNLSSTSFVPSSLQHQIITASGILVHTYFIACCESPIF